MTPPLGSIGLVTIPGAAGRLIRLGQWLNGDGYRNYEHAFVVVATRLGAVTIVEAEPGGAQLNPLHYQDVLWLPCPPEYGQAVADAARTLVGTPYSWVDYLALAAVRLRLPSKRLRAYVASSGHMMCSQLADHAAAVGGWHLYADGRMPEDVTPGDLTRIAAPAVRSI